MISKFSPGTAVPSLVPTGFASRWESDVAPIWNVLTWAPSVLAIRRVALAQATLLHPESLPATAPKPPADP